MTFARHILPKISQWQRHSTVADKSRMHNVVAGGQWRFVTHSMWSTSSLARVTFSVNFPSPFGHDLYGHVNTQQIITRKPNYQRQTLAMPG